MAPFGFIASPPSNGVHLGPLFVHAYGLAYVAAVLVAVAITARRWQARGGDRALVEEVAIWGFPAGLVGGRLYYLATSWNEVPDHWWGPFAVWRPAHATLRRRRRPWVPSMSTSS
jgi:prolipoprotein diacylglyceryltransferase